MGNVRAFGQKTVGEIGKGLETIGETTGTLEPMWNLFDMTREGRDEKWDEQMEYPPRPHCAHC